MLRKPLSLYLGEIHTLTSFIHKGHFYHFAHDISFSTLFTFLIPFRFSTLRLRLPWVDPNTAHYEAHQLRSLFYFPSILNPRII